MTTLFGIKNCDTVKKARRWLEDAAIDYQFHDFRGDGLTREQVERWLEQLDWQNLVNRRSTTWKQLPQVTRESLSEDNVIELVLEHPTLIKRPVLETDNLVKVGFKAADYETIFQ